MDDRASPAASAGRSQITGGPADMTAADRPACQVIGRHARPRRSVVGTGRPLLSVNVPIRRARCLQCAAMNALWAVWGAAAGYVVGAALRGTVFQLAVPGGQPDRTACPRRSAPARIHFPIGCERCGDCCGTPLVMELVTGTVRALVLGRFGGQPDTLAFAYLGALGVALC